jgi:hypothetical protein
MYLAEVYFWFLPEYQSYYAVIVMFDSRFMLRSLVALGRLKTWIRSSMSESRLCGLSMLHIHKSDTMDEINTTSVL